MFIKPPDNFGILDKDSFVDNVGMLTRSTTAQAFSHLIDASTLVSL